MDTIPHGYTSRSVEAGGVGFWERDIRARWLRI